jgi:hypothetical protein
MQKRGAAHAICALEFSNTDIVDLAQMIERVTGLDNIGDPVVWPAARQWSPGRYGGNVNKHAWQHRCRQQAVGPLQFGDADPVLGRDLFECVVRRDDVG